MVYIRMEGGGRGGAVLGDEASLALKMFDKTLRARTEMYSP